MRLSINPGNVKAGIMGIERRLNLSNDVGGMDSPISLSIRDDVRLNFLKADFNLYSSYHP